VLNGCSWCSEADPFDFYEFRKLFSGAYMANLAYDKARGNTVVASDHADCIAYGVPFIANPDSVVRFMIMRARVYGLSIFITLHFFVTPIWIGINT
jgi:hypothetical protein